MSGFLLEYLLDVYQGSEKIPSEEQAIDSLFVGQLIVGEHEEG